jgi:hypothetical protein
MWTQSGTRSTDVVITFPACFSTNPSMFIGLSVVDAKADRDGMVTVTVSIKSISLCEAVLSFNTWHDTKVAGLSANWMAYVI